MPRDGKRHQRITVKVHGQVGWGYERSGLVEGVPAHGRGVGTLPTQTILPFYDSAVLRCVKINSKRVISKGHYWLSCKIFARKENQLSTPSVLQSDTACSQFKPLPAYLIQTQLPHCCTAWGTFTFQLPFFRFLDCKSNSLTMDIPVYHLFCIIILLQDNSWHLAHFSDEYLCCRGCQLCSCTITGARCPCIQTLPIWEPQLRSISLVGCKTIWTVCGSLGSVSCKDVYRTDPALPLWFLSPEGAELPRVSLAHTISLTV